MKKVFTICCLAGTVLFSACKRDNNDDTLPTFNYSGLDTTSYSGFLKNAAGDTTTNRSIGRNYNQLLIGLAATIKTTNTTPVSADLLKNLYANSGNPYTSTYAYLNTTGLQIKSTVASSFSTADASKIQSDIESFLTKLATTSDAFSKTASNGNSGITSFTSTVNGVSTTNKYLVDEKGIEWGQVAQKALIGAYQLDYIGNVLLANTSADNSTILSGTKQTQLAQNWDRAYGVLTIKNVYGSGASSTSLNGTESQLGSYVWEYNPNYLKSKKALNELHIAFLTGRKAVENKDLTTVKAQSDKIRLIFEKAIAKSCIGYLGKWKTLSTEAEKMHALGEGLGFIYSLRFCKLSGCESSFSDEIFNSLISAGHWSLINQNVVDAENKIKAKFGL